MTTVIELNKTLITALRMSEALPNTQDAGSGRMHLLYAEDHRPVGYLVQKVAMEDAWESQDPRYFVTESHAEAVALLGMPFAELPQRETVAV